VTIVVIVAVQNIAPYYKYTQFKHASFKLRNSIHLFGWNITAFQAFVMSCLGQWRMSLHVEDGIKSYSSCPRYITILY